MAKTADNLDRACRRDLDGHELNDPNVRCPRLTPAMICRHSVRAAGLLELAPAGLR